MLRLKSTVLFRPKIFYILTALLLPLAIRAVPEILMGSYVSGFDQVGYYIPIVLNWLKGGADWVHMIAGAPLLYLVLMGTTTSGLSLFASLKILSPLILGFLSVTIYLYTSRALKWTPSKSCCASLLSTLYFVGLRISWDMLRTELGLIFVFMSLMFQGLNTKKGWILSAFSMLLVVLADQYAAVIILAIEMFRVVRYIYKKEYNDVKPHALIAMPSMLLFALSTYANSQLSSSFLVEQLSFPSTRSGAWFTLFGFMSYPQMATNMLLFLLFCYLPILPLAIKGATGLKDLSIKYWVLAAIVASFFPFLFSSAHYRWILLLNYPLALLAVEGAFSFKNKRRSRQRVLIALVVVMMLMSACFVISPSEAPLPYYTVFTSYVPTSMLQNTVPLRDCHDVEKALAWVRVNMKNDSCLLAHTAFYGWALTYLIQNQKVLTYGYGDPEVAANEAVTEGYHSPYLIWWENGYGWDGQPSVSQSFKMVFNSGKIAIYEYVPAQKQKSCRYGDNYV